MTLEAKIVLSREKKYWRYRPGDRVEGKLILNNPDKLLCSGIRVDLEALIRVNFKEHVDGRAVPQTKVEDAICPKIYTYVWPVNWSWAQITGKLDDERQMCLPAAKYSFPFNFEYPLATLPGTFVSEYGSVQHQVVAYIKTSCGFHKIAMQILIFGHYLNLAFDPVALSPLKMEKKKKSLMFSLVHPTSDSSPLQFTLKMPQRGFLPGEYAPFNLTVINLTGKRLGRILVSLIQKVCYHANNGKKRLGSVLDVTETGEADRAVETIWESGFYVPESERIHPSYRGSIEHQYFIKVQIFSKGSHTTPLLKGHVPIIIGTTRNPEDCCAYGGVRDGTGADVGAQSSSSCHSSSSRGRRTSLDLPRGSFDRLRSESPSLAEYSPPPSYSQLSSRAVSFDNFLPLYEDAMHNKKREEEVV